ncbi:hypothetical protein [Alginatibacterium sediminis]|uniref:hypothetical protein n=1 Tax=Alginatibacterium sediminis TaxID=2164068 RepID=UPI0011C4636C|nr:hypothetical protein [Alginatibacterium sediminis]
MFSIKIAALITVATLGLVSCSLFIRENAFGESWTGKPAEQLIQQWGEPSQKNHQENGGQELIYNMFNNSCTYYFYTDTLGLISRYKYHSETWGTCKPIG